MPNLLLEAGISNCFFPMETQYFIGGIPPYFFELPKENEQMRNMWVPASRCLFGTRRSREAPLLLSPRILIFHNGYTPMKWWISHGKQADGNSCFERSIRHAPTQGLVFNDVPKESKIHGGYTPRWNVETLGKSNKCESMLRGRVNGSLEAVDYKLCVFVNP